MSLLYDTNILIKIVRDKSETGKVRELVNPNELAEFTSLINKAEILSIALQNNWGARRMSRLEALFEEIIVIDLSDPHFLAYVNIDAFSQGKHPKILLKDSAKNMGKNDLWIAATVSVLNFTLITTDKDFDHLNDVFIKRILFEADNL
jgi:tRNA(fMet)-specific endonuclease VapC